ncbi:glycosyltransferase family 2 protein [Thermophilibacter sp.]
MRLTVKDNNTPKVSVVMAAYRTEQRYFEESISSILRQTEGDFEFIIVDDGLSSENRDYLRSLHDDRITVLVNDCNIGQSRSVNKAFGVVRGSYIFRMDSDDVSLPDRLKEQIAYMDQNPSLVACGAYARVLGGKRVLPGKHASRNAWLASMFFSNEMIHPTMCLRADVVKQGRVRYDESILYSQDYMMWVNLMEHGDVGIAPDVVLEYRVHEGQITNKKNVEQRRCALRAQLRLFEDSGIHLDGSLAEAHFGLVNALPDDRSSIDEYLRFVHEQSKVLGKDLRSCFLRYRQDSCALSDSP